MSDRTLALAMCFAGVMAIIAGLLSRAGKYRYWLRWYDNPEIPYYVRNAALGWVPAGMGLIALGVALVLFEGNDTSASLGMIAAGAFFASLPTVILITPTSPTWAKPHWLVARDATRAPPSGREDGVLTVLLTGIGFSVR